MDLRIIYLLRIDPLSTIAFILLIRCVFYLLLVRFSTVFLLFYLIFSNSIATAYSSCCGLTYG